MNGFNVKDSAKELRSNFSRMAKNQSLREKGVKKKQKAIRVKIDPKDGQV